MMENTRSQNSRAFPRVSGDPGFCGLRLSGCAASIIAGAVDVEKVLERE
jgi:hypothetical protein